MLLFSHNDVMALAEYTAEAIKKHSHLLKGDGIRAFPIPRGGVPAAYAVKLFLPEMEIVGKAEHANLFIDDVIDSGTTMADWCDVYPEKPFFTLVDKKADDSPFAKEWVLFPWEKENESQEDDSVVGTITARIRRAGAPFLANDNIHKYIASDEEFTYLLRETEKRAAHFLRGLIIDVDNDHNMRGTAHRIAKMYLKEVFKGRYVAAPQVTDFPNAKNLDEMYMTGPITIRSACSHHLAPIIGKCWIGIIPGERVIGLSKFNRIVEWLATRPQIQEELVVQIADFIEQQVAPKGLAVVVEATHQCMTWRGVKESMDAKMTTNVMRGAFRDRPEARAEFMALVTKRS
jgi:GTP cyclohydrolase I